MQFFQELFYYSVIKHISIIPSPTLTHFSQSFLIPALLPCPPLSRVSASTSRWRQREEETIVTEGNRATGREREKAHLERNLTRCGEAILSRVRLLGKISSGNLRRGTPALAEISSPEIGKTGNWLPLCVYVYVQIPCSFVVYVCARNGGGYFNIGISEGSEREIPGIDWSPGRSSGRISEREHHGRKCEPYSISAVRLSRHFYRARGAETCYWQACTFVIEID